MTEITEALVMPPVNRLLALMEPDPTLLARVVLAMQVWGAVWHYSARGSEWWLSLPTEGGGFRTLLALWGEGRVTVTDDLPNPFADTVPGRAAAWELMERRVEDVVHGPQGSVRATYRDASGHAQWGPAAGTRRMAVILASLQSGADGPLSPLIRPLLERMETQLAALVAGAMQMAEAKRG